ncbi:hypothetical protein Q3P06_25185 [Ralstonia pseudosolanacearum]|uniref:hypothetical protein n=1 Tax=Ralstonia pseudosolanacearum TaxID=1310165 RepID=UPI002675B6DC|nr:hypothetical protein [Ralstonia pseudosolanacearum]MDO3515183.1 hypothetical protein [Ralstonia pseudosolanacearum]MDO3634009.1 hypothetical protein [Ralstonia pseudosolanacearum]
MSHLRLVAGTDLSELPDTPTRAKDSKAGASRIQAEAREALRNLTLPGQDKTIGELRDALAQLCRKRFPKSAKQRAMHDRLVDLLLSAGIFLRATVVGRRGELEFSCVVWEPDELVAAYPQFEPYLFVLHDVEF